MKKLLSLLLVVLALTLVLGLASCGDDSSTTTTNQDTPVDPPLDDHEHSYQVAVTSPKCTEQGYTTYTCACGDSYVDDYVDANGHSFGEWVTVKDPTSTEDGLKERICDCGEKETQVMRRPSEGLLFELNSDKASYSVAGKGTCTDMDIVIPSSYMGKPVTGISDGAFYCMIYSITSVVIPDTVTIIGFGAFESCESLKYIIIPDSVTSIGKNAFLGCYALTNIIVSENNQQYKSIDGNLYSKDGKTFIQYAIGKSDASFTIPIDVTTIAHMAFGSAPSLKNVVLNNNITSIEDYAFHCSSVESINIPDSVTSIAYSAFEYCNSLKSIVIPNSVTIIESRTFYHCDSLTSIEIPDSVTYIGTEAFGRCSSLVEINVDENNEYYKSIDGNLYSKDGKQFLQYAIGKTDDFFAVPSGVIYIMHDSFELARSLKNVTIPYSVMSIGSNAFGRCYSLISISIPDSVESKIYRGTFYYCSQLTIYCAAENKPDSWAEEWNCCDDKHNNGTNYCTVVWGATMPCLHNETEVIEGKDSTCFELGYTDGKKCKYCGKMLVAQETISLKDHLESDWIIDQDATTVEQGKKHIECTVCGTTIYEDIIPVKFSEGFEFVLNDDGKSYSLHWMGDCQDNDINIPSTYNNLPVTTIEGFAFLGCTNLTSVVIPNSITSIGKNAFYNCSSLKELVISDNLTYIDSYAFYNCSSLKEIVIPDGVMYIGEQAFGQCSSLKNIYVSNNNQYYKSINGNLYSKDGKILIRYAVGKDDMLFNVPEGVTCISDNAFDFCNYLTHVILPDTVTSIGKYAFRESKLLKSIVIPSSVTTIGVGAFERCMSLSSVEIGSGVTSIGEYAFYYCRSLTSIVIPDSVTYIGLESFADCVLLSNVIIGNGVTSIGEYAFHYCISLKNIAIPSSVTSIGECAFSRCKSLTSISVSKDNEFYQDIDGNLYSADGKIFIQYACGKKDKAFTLSNSVTSIESAAFSECDSLTSVVIPDSLMSIGGFAFSSCNLLQYNEYNNALYLGNENNPYYALIEVKDENITTCEINGKTKVIADFAFIDCHALTSVVIPDSVTTIGKYAFVFCDSLTSVVIPDSVTSIGEGVFNYCDSLTRVVIPESVTTMGTEVFYGCDKDKLTIYCEAEYLPNGWNSNWNRYEYNYIPVIWGYKEN